MHGNGGQSKGVQASGRACDEGEEGFGYLLITRHEPECGQNYGPDERSSEARAREAHAEMARLALTKRLHWAGEAGVTVKARYDSI